MNNGGKSGKSKKGRWCGIPSGGKFFGKNKSKGKNKGKKGKGRNKGKQSYKAKDVVATTIPADFLVRKVSWGNECPVETI